MKAISLWEPWASAIRCGVKTIETRSWITHHRGPIAIHAAKRRNVGEIDDLLDDDEWQNALVPLTTTHGKFGRLITIEDLTFGCIVAVADLHQIERAEWVGSEDLYREGLFGDYRRGRFAWRLRDVRALRHPIQCTGRQGVFNIPDNLLTDNMLLPGPLTTEARG